MASPPSERTPLLESGSSNSQNSLEGTPPSYSPSPRNSCSRWCHKLFFCISCVTVEFPLFLYLFVWSFQGLIRTNILLDKICDSHFNYSPSVCESLQNHTAEQINVQQYANKINLYISLIENIPGVLFVLFLGAWSDSNGRKVPLTLPHIGNLISDMIMLVNILIWCIPVEYVLFASIPKAVTGGFACMVMVSNSYISDISSRENRTVRIAFLDLFFAVSPPCGLVMCAFVLGRFGYTGTYVLSIAVFLVCIMYIVLRIVETRGPNARGGLNLEQELERSRGDRGKIISIFDSKHIRDAFKTTFKSRENYGRTKILVLMSAMCCLVFVFSSLSLDYLYTQKKFLWDYYQYINYCVSSLVITGIGVGAFLPILSMLFHLSDVFLALVGCVSLIGSKLAQAFATVGYEMYIGAGIGFFGGAPLVVCRSTMSKLVANQDTGKIFSILASWESLVPLIASPIFTLTYNATIDTSIYSYLLVGAGVYGLAFLLFLVVYVLNWRHGNGYTADISH